MSKQTASPFTIKITDSSITVEHGQYCKTYNESNFPKECVNYPNFKQMVSNATITKTDESEGNLKIFECQFLSENLVFNFTLELSYKQPQIETIIKTLEQTMNHAFEHVCVLHKELYPEMDCNTHPDVLTLVRYSEESGIGNSMQEHSVIMDAINHAIDDFEVLDENYKAPYVKTFYEMIDFAKSCYNEFLKTIKFKLDDAHHYIKVNGNYVDEQTVTFKEFYELYMEIKVVSFKLNNSNIEKQCSYDKFVNSTNIMKQCSNIEEIKNKFIGEFKCALNSGFKPIRIYYGDYILIIDEKDNTDYSERIYFNATELERDFSKFAKIDSDFTFENLVKIFGGCWMSNLVYDLMISTSSNNLNGQRHVISKLNKVCDKIKFKRAISFNK